MAFMVVAAISLVVGGGASAAVGQQTSQAAPRYAKVRQDMPAPRAGPRELPGAGARVGTRRGDRCKPVPRRRRVGFHGAGRAGSRRRTSRAPTASRPPRGRDRADGGDRRRLRRPEDRSRPRHVRRPLRPAACTMADGCLKKVGQTGSTTVASRRRHSRLVGRDQLSTSRRSTASAQSCKILLVEASSERFADLAASVNEAVGLGATEVSNSYGGLESSFGASEQAAYDHPGVVIAASAGDSGYLNWDDVVRAGPSPGHARRSRLAARPSWRSAEPRSN